MKNVYFHSYLKLIITLILLFLFSLQSITAQDRGIFTLSLYPNLNIPLGDSGDIYTLNGGGQINGDIYMPFAPQMHGRIMLNYNMLPTEAETNLNMISLGAGIGANFFFMPKLRANITGLGGYGLGIYEGSKGSCPFIAAEFELSYLFSPAFSVGIGTSYRHYFSEGEKLFNQIGVSVGISYNFGAGKREANIEVDNINIDPIFPVFYKYYDDNQLGELVLHNTENGTIKDVIVDFYVAQYMERPKECIVIEEIAKDEEVIVPLYALFTDEILEITESTKLTAEITVTYSILNDSLMKEEVQTIRIYDRNALTWDDARKAASFVTSKDPAILGFSKNIAGIIRASGTSAVNLNFRMALGLFEALRIYGINYVTDPKTPYAEFSENLTALDFLQFPRQTMEYSAGDCDDLSILFSAMLESIGIETAFITVPGHIYMAFSLDISPEEASSLFLETDDLIFIDNNSWVPVEITMVSDGFLLAWQTGAQEWRENEISGNADFYPIHTAWETYEPVGMIGEEKSLDLPNVLSVSNAYADTLNEFIEREIQPRVEELTAAIRENNNAPTLVNKLGVLYARFGFLDKAEEQFKLVLEQKEDISALANMGNISYLNKDFIIALDYFSRAYNIDSSNPKVLAGLAKTYYEIEDYSSVINYYDKLKIADEELATRFSYLVSETNETGRASSTDIRGVVVWNEE